MKLNRYLIAGILILAALSISLLLGYKWVDMNEEAHYANVPSCIPLENDPILVEQEPAQNDTNLSTVPIQPSRIGGLIACGEPRPVDKEWVELDAAEQVDCSRDEVVESLSDWMCLRSAEKSYVIKQRGFKEPIVNEACETNIHYCFKAFGCRKRTPEECTEYQAKAKREQQEYREYIAKGLNLCQDLPKHLDACTPFKCYKNLMQQRVVGMEDGKCVFLLAYPEGIGPPGPLTSCHLEETTRKALAEEIRLLDNTKDVGIAVKNATSYYIIDEKKHEHVISMAAKTSECHVLGSLINTSKNWARESWHGGQTLCEAVCSNYSDFKACVEKAEKEGMFVFDARDHCKPVTDPCLTRCEQGELKEL